MTIDRIESKGQSKVNKMALKSNMFPMIKAVIFVYIINFIVEVMSESKGV